MHVVVSERSVYIYSLFLCFRISRGNSGRNNFFQIYSKTVTQGQDSRYECYFWTVIAQTLKCFLMISVVLENDTGTSSRVMFVLNQLKRKMDLIDAEQIQILFLNNSITRVFFEEKKMYCHTSQLSIWTANLFIKVSNGFYFSDCTLLCCI